MPPVDRTIVRLFVSSFEVAQTVPYSTIVMVKKLVHLSFRELLSLSSLQILRS